MGNTIYLAGLGSNLLSRSCQIIPDPAASTSFSTTSLFDGEPGSVFRFTSAAAACEIAIDTDVVKNGAFGDASVPFPSSWDDISCGTGAVADGTGNAELSAGTSGIAGIRQDITVHPGEVFSLYGDLYGGTTNHIKMSVQNRQTGHYVNAAGAWSTTLAFYLTQSSGSTHATGNASVTVESYENCNYKRDVTIRIEVISTTPSTEAGNATVVDNITLRHRPNFISIHGHNLDPTIQIKVQHDDTSSFASPTTAGEPTILQPAFYTKLTSGGNDTWYRILFNGTNSSPIEIGEIWLGRYETLSDTPQYGWEEATMMPVSENQSISGRQYMTARSYHPSESISVDFFATTTDASGLHVDELKEMMDRGVWGEEPTVFVPWDSEDKVYLGTLTPGYSGVRPLRRLYEFKGITLQGFPFVKRVN